MTAPSWGPLADPDLAWLWHALADVADKAGDPDLAGAADPLVTLPAAPAQRAAAAGWIQGKTQTGGVRRRVLLDPVRQAVALRAPGWTLGQAVASLSGRQLAVAALRRAQAAAERAAVSDSLHEAALAAGLDPARLVEHLQRAGWVTRLTRTPQAAAQAVQVAAQVLRLPPGERVDRRLLVPDDPHALDEGRPLAGAVLAVLAFAGRTSAEGTTRARWAQASVDIDDIMGGLAMTGIVPAGWFAPTGAVVTVPPRELACAAWPAPPKAGGWVLVTENPSVLAAAADMAGTEQRPGVRVVCTLGTPSRLEAEAVAGLVKAGWRVAVRCDFDPAGIAHTNMILEAVPDARPWRMSAQDYLDSNPSVPLNGPIGPTPWDPALAERMAHRGLAAFEEALLQQVLSDLRAEAFALGGRA
ncbi:DUF2399 domain-containing protein [Puerhibacterium sp. TATVAM-FAB25]|uniref:DUF2399 domain-containing protein n=1 Tax=Puerhibacterium sp. TATVAM-FAB25 TaxID=3093699 RepID=UPI003978138E